MLLLHLAASPALLQIPVLPSILPLPLASLPPSLVISIPCLQICFLGIQARSLQCVSLPSPPPWPHPPGCLSPPGNVLCISTYPQLHSVLIPRRSQALSPFLSPADALQPLHLLRPSRARSGRAPPVLCDRTQAAEPSCQQGTGGGLSLPSPVHLPWAELALEVAQSSPITSGACLCSLGRRINYQGCGAVDHSSYYFLLLQIGVVESSVPFNPRSSVYFPAGSTNAAFPITSQRASDRSLRKTCCNCLFFSIFKHF